MGFDEIDRQFVIPVSDTQAYKQFGNAVVAPVIKAVAQHMLPWLVPTQLEFANLTRGRELQAVG